MAQIQRLWHTYDDIGFVNVLKLSEQKHAFDLSEFTVSLHKLYLLMHMGY